MEAVTLKKYPRTPHLEGSRLQAGDEDLSQVPFSYIKGKHLVVEEKIDGANTAISFSEEGELLLQSRGHYLTGGYRERHYNLMKQWANIHQDAFFEVLGTRYIMYGEWMYAKHSIFFSLLRKAIIVVPLTLLLPRLGFGVLGVFMAEPISNVIGGLASYITMRMTVYRRIENSIREEN